MLAVLKTTRMNISLSPISIEKLVKKKKKTQTPKKPKKTKTKDHKGRKRQTRVSNSWAQSL